MSKVIWEGYVSDIRVRIVQFEEDQAIVERWSRENGKYVALDNDAMCADAYMTALLEKCR